MRKLLRYTLIAAFLTGGSVSVFSQSFPDLHLQRLTAKDGLSDDYVATIIQDHRGFLWMGTGNGLNRFDGYRFKQFYHRNGDSASLPGNSIARLYLDAKDNLWITTHTGLGCFNTLAQQCLPIRHNRGEPAVLESYELPYVYIDSADSMWVTTREGLYAFDKRLTYHPVQGVSVDSFVFFDLLKTHYNSITRDKKGRLWAFAGNRIYLLDVSTKKPVRTWIGPPDLSINFLLFDKDDRCWLTGWGKGLYEFIPEKQLFRHIALGGVPIYYGPMIEWTVGGKRWLVIGTDHNSFVLVDPGTDRYRIYKNDGLRKDVPSNIPINCLFADRQNILWLGTSEGVQFVTPSSALFDLIPVYHLPPAGFPKGKSSMTAYAYLPDPSGNWVSGWYNGGVCRYDSQWRLKKHIAALWPTPRGKPVTNRSIFSMRRYGREIYCTSDSGLFAIDTANYHIRAFFPPDEGFAAQFRTILPVDGQRWWIRSARHGIYVFDLARQQFVKRYTRRQGHSDCLPSDTTNGIAVAPDGRIYITTDNGLCEYRPATDNFACYTRSEQGTVIFPGNSLYGIAIDSTGRAWIGTNYGVCVFNTRTKKLETPILDNPTIGAVYRICVDAWQNVWFRGSNYNWCWLRKEKRLLHFNVSEWLPVEQGLGLLRSGEDSVVYNGGESALIRYYPEKLMHLVIPPAIPVVVSDIFTGGRLLPFGFDAKKKKTITLTASQNSFTVDFAVLNYDGAGNNKFYYRLLPAVTDWRANDNGHLTFYDLSPGTYRLEVKGGNEWNGEFPGGDSLTIVVQPHWWQSWLFYTLIGLAVAGSVVFFVKRRVRYIRKEAAYVQQQAVFRQRIAETEMQALRAQMNPHFIFNSLNSIENFMMKNDKRMASDYFGKFATLIRMILDSSRNEAVPFEKDIAALQLYVELEQLRFDQSFSYEARIDAALLSGNYSVPPLLIQPYVENAIIHGLAQSEKPELQLSITATLTEGTLVYTIQDNGIGRRKARTYKQDKITHEGMGMRISKERIDILNQQQQARVSVDITDLYDAHEEPSGTLVRVCLAMTGVLP